MFIVLILFPSLVRAGEEKGIILRGQFSDTKFSISESQTEEIADRAAEWLNAQLGPDRTFSFDLGPIATLSANRAWYAANTQEMKDARIGEAVRELCIACDPKVDFSKYKHLVILFAGGSESDGAGSDYVWPQMSTLSANSYPITLDGTKLDTFIDLTETCRAGTLCHEFMHGMGLEDFYDTDGEWSGGLSKGLRGSLSIMDKGMWNDGGNTPPFLNAIELEALGMGTCEPLTPGSHVLQPIGKSRTYLKFETGTEGEYYLFECRKAESWDKFTGGEGMVIYHIDKSAGNAWYSDYYRRNLTGAERWQFNQINCRPDHECAELMEADPHSDSIEGVFFPQAGHDSFGSDTEPSWRFWNGDTSPFAITDITRREDGSVAFEVITPIIVKSCETFQDAVILQWSLDQHLVGQSCEISWTEGLTTHSSRVLDIGPSDFAFTVEGLRSGVTYSITIRATDDSGNTFSTICECTTKPMLEGVHPYISFGGASRREDGSFEIGSKILLKVFNAADVAETRWYMDGQRIGPIPDSRFIITASGTLKAEVFYKQGGKDIIIKEITAR